MSNVLQPELLIRAKLLGSETNWKILEALRDVGIDGLSAEEISETIKVPKSSVYSIPRESATFVHIVEVFGTTFYQFTKEWRAKKLPEIKLK